MFILLFQFCVIKYSDYTFQQRMMLFFAEREISEYLNSICSMQYLIIILNVPQTDYLLFHLKKKWIVLNTWLYYMRY